MKSLLLIFFGGGLGSVARFFLGRWINSVYSFTFPLGTFAINIGACLVLGFVVGLADNKQMLSAATKLFWVVGFCGGFSTFSTFSNESLVLMQTGHGLTSVLYIFLSVLLCLAATYVGLAIANSI
jgi:CrcB protein